MAVSAEAAAIIEDMIAGNKKAAFGDPDTLAAIMEASRLEQQAPYSLPSYVFDAACVEEVVLDDGTPCFVLTPHKESYAEVRPSSPRRYILYFHGGGFVMQIGESHWRLCLALMEELECAVMVPLYPLAPVATYREAYRSMMSAYRFALSCCSAQDLVVMGDSAGGHLAIASAQTALMKNLPQPSLVVAFSPWLDMADEILDRDLRAEDDPLIGSYGMRRIPLDWAPGAKSDPMFPPCVLHGPFVGLAPLMVVSGSREFLLGDAEACVSMARTAGVSTRFDVYEGMWHVFPLMGKTPEGDVAIESVLNAIRGETVGFC